MPMRFIARGHALSEPFEGRLAEMIAGGGG
jgi:hypothetical protein